jgi:hypothetical protein
MCKEKKSCACACKKKVLVEGRQPLKESRANTIITIKCADGENTLKELVEFIKANGNGGHSFSIDVDKEYADNPNVSEHRRNGGKTFYWDGDGSDYIEEIKVEKIGEEKPKEGLQESKQPLKENTRKDLVKQAKNALDSLYQTYSICESAGVDKDELLEKVDKSFQELNELLTYLVSQK